MQESVQNQSAPDQHSQQSYDIQSILTSINQKFAGLTEQLKEVKEQLNGVKEQLDGVQEQLDGFQDDTAKKFSMLGIKDLVEDSNSSTTEINEKSLVAATVKQLENDVATNAVPNWLDRCIVEVSQLFSKIFFVHAKLD